MSTEGQKEGLMTQGSISKQLLAFAMPLLLGNLFQQLYNAVDSAVVGHYVGDAALAAVGSSGSLINMIVSLFMGVATGGSVIISQYYGARDRKGLHDALHTVLAFSLIAGVMITLVGYFLSPAILRFMDTPEDVMPMSVRYLQIIFLGAVPMVIYNMGSGLLRALGDSRRPLYFLILASVLNIILDILFVAAFCMGVAGAAWATILAQAVSAVMVMVVLVRTDEEYKVTLRDIRIHPREMASIIRLGLPSGIQGAIVSFSNVIVQSNINVFGKVVMAGCSAYIKIDGFVILPVMSMSMTLTTFVGQNIGALEYDRVKRGAKIGVAMGAGITLALTLVLQGVGGMILGIFTADQEVIGYGLLMMRVLSLGYCLLAVSHCMAGILRGVGLTKIPMFIMVLCWCVIRVVWIVTLGRRLHNLPLVLGGYPVTWLLSAVLFAVYMWKVDWIHYYEKKLRRS